MRYYGTHDIHANQEEAAELRGLVMVLGTAEAQQAAERYLLWAFIGSWV